MRFVERFLAAYLRSGLRGSFRLTDLLASRMSSFQKLPINIEGGTLIADLRISSARAILAYPYGETGEALVMRQFVKPGDFALDIGAHLGYYTVLLSSLVGTEGRVSAFEPNPELLSCLRSTLSSLENVELYETALSDRDGTIEMFVPEDASMGSLRDWTRGTAGNVRAVKCRMSVLDELYGQGLILLPAFIKCDVEGAELSVFRGAREILNRRDAPIVMFELNSRAAAAFGTRTEEYFEFLESLPNPNFQFLEVTKDGPRRLASKTSEHSNVLAIPRQRFDERFSGHSNF